MNYYKFIEETYPEIVQEITKINGENSDYTSPSSVYGSLFEYFYKNYKTGVLNLDSSKKILKIIEDTLNFGTEEFQEAATISFLEDLSNKNFIDLYKFSKEYIGEKSAEQINLINNFWHGE